MNPGAQPETLFLYKQTTQKHPCSDNKRSGGATEVKGAGVYDACPAL